MQKRERHWRHAMCLSFRWIIQWCIRCSNHKHRPERLSEGRRKNAHEEMKINTNDNVLCVQHMLWIWQQETVKTIISIFNESLGTSVRENAYAHHILHSQSALLFHCRAEGVSSTTMSSSLSSSSSSSRSPVHLDFLFVYLRIGLKFLLRLIVQTSNEKFHMQNSISRFSPKIHQNAVCANNKQTGWIRCITKSSTSQNWFFQLIYSMFCLNFTWKSTSLQRDGAIDGARARGSRWKGEIVVEQLLEREQKCAKHWMWWVNKHGYSG